MMHGNMHGVLPIREAYTSLGVWGFGCGMDYADKAPSSFSVWLLQRLSWYQDWFAITSLAENMWCGPWCSVNWHFLSSVQDLRIYILGDDNRPQLALGKVNSIVYFCVSLYLLYVCMYLYFYLSRSRIVVALLVHIFSINGYIYFSKVIVISLYFY